MAIKIDFLGTLIWTIVLIAGIQILHRLLTGATYCAAAIILCVAILLIANRKIIMAYFRRGHYY
ncbi:MAG: hypothetical protein J7L88_04645 [Thermoplasmata archaeon]|nr:hypothetical protein [Thermoplasmata archaeon]